MPLLPVGSMIRLLPVGSSAVLVELDGLDTVVALHEVLRRDPPTGAAEFVPAARTILIHFDPALTAADRFSADVERVARTVVSQTEPVLEAADLAEVSIPVVYDGPDLAEVAARTGMRSEEVIDRHTAGRYRVAFCGFAPGFAYLTGLDPLLHVPRRDAPRTQVPVGSVAVADRFTAVYPQASPGGWHLLGRTSEVMWDVDRQPPALLPPGTAVRFVQVSA